MATIRRLYEAENPVTHLLFQIRGFADFENKKVTTTLVGGGRKWRMIDIDRESYFFEFDRRKCFATQMRLDDARRVLRLGAHEVDKVAEVKVNSGEAFK